MRYRISFFTPTATAGFPDIPGRYSQFFFTNQDVGALDEAFKRLDADTAANRESLEVWRTHSDGKGETMIYGC